MSRTILIAVASCVCAAAACGSGRFAGSAATRPVTTALADTPEAAALGFEDSLDRSVEYRFACLAGNRFATAGFVPIGPVTARTERTGESTWAVTLVDEQYGPQPLHRWKVRRIGDGYCVAGELPAPRPRLGPSSPGSGSDSHSSSRTP